MENFHGRKGMDMNMREFVFYALQDFTVIRNIPVREKPALDADLGGTNIYSRPGFFKDFRDGQDIPILLLERAEFACPDAHVREIDIPVDYKSNIVSDCSFAKPVRKGKEKSRIIMEF